MNYRKRHQLQHKVELSTLLRIVMVKKKRSALPQVTEINLTKGLAAEAIVLAERCDTALIVKKKRTVLEHTKAVY